MKKLLTYIINAIVENEDKVEINESEEDGIINYSIKVDPADMGRVIGKNGKVIKAVRNIMKIPAMKNNKKVFVTLVETP